MDLLPRADRVALLELCAFLHDRANALANTHDALPDDRFDARELVRLVRDEMDDLYLDIRSLLNFDTEQAVTHDTA